MTDVFSIDELRRMRHDRDQCLKQIRTIPFLVKPNGQVMTKDEHLQARLKKEAIEQAARDRL